MKIRSKEKKERYQPIKPLLMSILLIAVVVILVQGLMVQPVQGNPGKEAKQKVKYNKLSIPITLILQKFDVLNQVK